MSIWDLFSKNKKSNETKDETAEEETQEVEEIEEKEDPNKPIAEYNETIHSDTGKREKDKSTDETYKKQHIWRNVDKIEENVDNIHIKNAKKPSTEIDKKVDGIITKTKKKLRKPSNVIYVVSNPQPGQVKGDWAVRSHGKIFSHHRIKENAIKQARKIAIERKATVMVQNTDGTFSDGFKPRAKK